MKKVPKPFKKKAATLLQIFDERPNEITWDSSGNIYLDEQSLPGSNIFDLFPYLFRKRSPKSLTGLSDFVEKLKSMGLGHLISNSLLLKKGFSVGSTKTNLETTEPPKNWWYLG